MRVLVACEYSGTVRDAFRAAGHDAVSCDLLPTEREGPHIVGDVLDVIGGGWDLMVAHPPCTYLTVSGNSWMSPDAATKDPTVLIGTARQEAREHSLDFVRALLAAPIQRIAVENPIGVISTRIRLPDQVIQPWQFGHGEVKATCLWLVGLHCLRPTRIVAGRVDRLHRLPPSPERWKERSRTYQGIADAMAAQWGTGATRMEQLILIG